MIKNKDVVLKVLTLLFCCFSITYCSAIKKLFNHREYFEKLAVTCRTPLGDDCNPIADKLFIEMRHKSLKEWKKNEDKICRAFTRMCFYSAELPNYHLDDTLLINLLIETLGELSPRANRSAISHLEDIPYQYLTPPRRAKIIDKLKRVDDISFHSRLVAAIDPPASMKEQLFASRRFENDHYKMGIKARLGDKESERELIAHIDALLKLSIGVKERFGNEERVNNFIDSMWKANVDGFTNTYRPDFYERIINNLLLCGTDECLKTALGFFAKFQPRLDSKGRVHKDQYGSQGRLNPLESIIIGFRKYHPHLPLLHEELDSLLSLFLRQQRKGLEEEITEYMEKFINWANKEYGTNFKLESNLLFTGQQNNEIYHKKKQNENDSEKK
ncbi:MAG: hypothetical protein LBI42_14190 [Chitinispirillales bacterium]|jgi:hypothetical protein|nr:hypothetical protein [Chitinispirillales bacterium]